MADMTISFITNSLKQNLGFRQTYLNPGIISSIDFYCPRDFIDPTDKERGHCCIHYTDGTEHEIPLKCDFYNHQYGIPLSRDGKALYIGCWEKRGGIRKIDIETGKDLWKVSLNHMRNIYVDDDYIVALQAYKAIYKMRADTGEIIAQIRGGSISNFIVLRDGLLLLDTYKNHLCLIDTENMEIVRIIADSEYIPEKLQASKCLICSLGRQSSDHGRLQVQRRGCAG